MTEADIRRLLAQRCNEVGGQTAFAKLHGMSQSQVCDTLRGQREASAMIANALGFMKVVRFIPSAIKEPTL